MDTPAPKRKAILFLLIAGTLLAGYSGSHFAPGDWYRGLVKPAWTPPGPGHRPGLGGAVCPDVPGGVAGMAPAGVAVLFLTILATIWTFGRVDRLAAWLLGPYVLWVGFDLVWHFFIWRLNG